MSRIPEDARRFIYEHDIYKRMVEADVPGHILLGVRFMVYDAWREAQRVDKLIGKLGGSNPPLVGSTTTRPAIRGTKCKTASSLHFAAEGIPQPSTTFRTMSTESKMPAAPRRSTPSRKP